MRRKRMADLVARLGIGRGARVLDLGGQPEIWNDVVLPLDITILNLPGVATRDVSSSHALVYVEGDACAVDGIGDGQFDLAFSNSVIEHVGDRHKRADFAKEVRRLGRAYWVQTPSKWFPIEAHTGMPFWWFLPESLRRYFIARWKGKLPAWTEMIESTTFVERAELQSLFPDGTLVIERLMGIPKSYIVFRRAE